MNLKHFILCLSICTFVALAGCGKKAESPASQPLLTPSDQSTASTNPATLSEADKAIIDRRLDYVTGLVDQKQFDKARPLLKQVEAEPITGAQRQRFEKLKARIPGY